jgi:hypothetical protein
VSSAVAAEPSLVVPTAYSRIVELLTGCTPPSTWPYNVGGGGPEPPPATPVPVKETVSGELAALLGIERDALRVPAAEGVNTTCTTHDAPAASVAGQPAATPKSLAAAPEKLAPLRVIAAAPVFVTVTDRAVEATPTVAEGNVSADGEPDTLEEGGGTTLPATPVPVKETVSGEFAALLAIKRDALRVPAAVGVNTTCTTHDAPPASVAGQPAATLKSLAAAPEKLTPLRVIAAAPVFVIVTDYGVEATPTVAEGNVSADGEQDTLEEGGGATLPATPVPVKETVS